MHKSLDGFEIRPDPTTGFHGNRYCYNLKNGVATFSRVLDGILFILTGNDDIHESLDEFEIWPDQTTGFYGNRQGYNGKNGVTTFSWLFLSNPFHTCR